MPFKRPPDVPVGQIWRTFQGKERDGKPAKTYEIRDLDPKEKEQCLQMTMSSFLKDEPLCQTLEILSDPSSVATILSNWSGYIDQGLTLACSSAGKVAGHALCEVICRDDEEIDFDLIKGEQWKKLLKTLMSIEQSFDVFSHYGVDKYLSINVMSVNAEDRGQNIGAQFFRAAENMAQAMNIPVIATACTAFTSQSLAEKCGYTILSKFSYKNMLEYGIDLTGCSCEVAKLYGKKID